MERLGGRAVDGVSKDWMLSVPWSYNHMCVLMSCYRPAGFGSKWVNQGCKS